MNTARDLMWVVFHLPSENGLIEAATITGETLCLSRNPYAGASRVLITMGHDPETFVLPVWIERWLSKRGYRETRTRNCEPITLADLARWPIKEKLGRVLPFRKTRRKRRSFEGRQT